MAERAKRYQLSAQALKMNRLRRAEKQTYIGKQRNPPARLVKGRTESTPEREK